MGSLTQLLGIPKRSEWRQRLHDLAPQMVVVAFLLLVAALVGTILVLVPAYLRIPVALLSALIIIMLWRNEPFDLLVIFTLIAIFADGGMIITRDIVYEPLEYIGYFVFLLYLLHRLASGKKGWFATSLDLPIFIFVGVIFVNAIYSLMLGNLFTNVLRETLMYPRFILFYYMVVNVITNRERLNYYLLLFLIILAFLGTYSIYQYFFGGLELSLEGYGVGGRVIATFGNANLYAGFLELSIPVLFSYVISDRNLPNRFLLSLLCGLLFLNGILTFSRGALGGIIAALMILTILRSRQRVIILLLMLLLIVVLATTTNLLTRQLALVFSTTEVRTEYTIIHRVEQYSGYLKTFLAQPIFGVGWGSFAKTTAPGMFVRSQFEIYSFGHLNSAYFDFLVHEGIIGLSSLLILFISVGTVFARAGRRLKSHPDAAMQWGIFAGTLAFFVHQLMDNFLKWSQVNAMFWIIIGVGIAMQRIHINERQAMPRLDKAE
jgi:putative inorganic carbon (hco3(-)) transporter